MNAVERHAHFDSTTSATLSSLLLAGAIILPLIPLGPLGLRISDLVALLPIPFFIGLRPAFLRSTFVKWYFWFVLAALLSLFHGYIWLEVPPLFRDFNEIARLAMPIFVMWAALAFDKKSAGVGIESVLYWGSFFVLSFGLLQFVAPSLLPRPLLQAWGGSAHVRTLLEFHVRRVFATGSDPNTGAAIALLFLYYHVIGFWYRRRWSNLFMSLGLLLLVALTGSRTAFIALAFTASVVAVASGQLSRGQRRSLLLALLVSLVVIWFSVDYVRLGILQAIQGRSGSWSARLDRFSDAIELFKKSPVFGWGPAKAIHTTVSDGEYFMNLRRYGTVGILTFSIFFFGSIVSVLTFVRKRLSEVQKQERILVLTLLAFGLTGVVVMITNVFISGYQLAIPYALLLGHFDAIRREANPGTTP